MADHKDQHWIPRSYVKAWCDPEKRDKVVHRYNPEGDYLDWRPYTRIASEDDLYTIFDGEQRDVWVEAQFLSGIERRFAAVVREVERRCPLPAASKAIFAWYVAAMRQRSPSARDHWQDFQRRVVEAGEAMEDALGAMDPISRKRAAEAMRVPAPRDGHRMTIDEARAAAAEPFGAWLPRHIAIEAGMLQKMSFELLKVPAGTSLITSDNPVTWRNRAVPFGNAGRFPGLRHPAIEITMPLTPEWCLAFNHENVDAVADLTAEGVDVINSRTLAMCDEFFIANSSNLVVDWQPHPPG